MVKWHLNSKKALTGKRLRRVRKKRSMDRGSEFLETKIGNRKVKSKKSRGGNQKHKLLSVDKINVSDPENNKVKRAKIISVEKNEANPHFVRRNVLTKGSVVKTEMGTVRVTSRPGQDGMVNGVLVEKNK